MRAMPAPAAASAAPSGQSSVNFWVLLAVLVAAEFATALEGNMIYVALAKLYGIYGDPTHVSWLITAYSLTSAASAALCSRLGDLYGRRRMLILMLVVAAVGSAISAVASDLNVIIFGRALQGVSLAILPLAFGILRENARDNRELNMGVGVLGGTYSLSTGTGIILGGVIVDSARWQHIFTVSAAAAVLALILALRFIPKGEVRRATERLDLLGVLFVFPISALLLGLTFGKSLGWDSPVVWGLLIGGVAGLAAWTAYELRQASPLIDVRLLKNPTIAVVNATIFFTAMAPMIYPQVVMPLLQQPVWTGIGLGVTATVAGIIKLPTNLTAGVAGFVSGLVARRHSMRPAIIVSTIANLVAFVAIIFVHDSLVFVVAMCVLLIAPAGTILFACAPGLIIEAAPAERTSEATGLTSVLRALAMAIGSQLIAFTLATSSVLNSEGAKYPDERAYVITFVMVAVCCLASLICALMIPRRRVAVASRQLAPAPAE